MDIATKKLKEERAQAVTQMHTLVKTAETDNRGLSADERTNWDNLNSAVESLDSRIDDAKRSNTLFADLDSENERQLAVEGRSEEGSGNKQLTNEEKSKQESEIRSQAFSAILRSPETGHTGLSVEQAQALQQLRSQARAAQGMEVRAQSVGTASAGGYLIPEDFANVIINKMLAFGGIRGAATVIRSTTGADMPFQVNNDTGNAGALLAENTADSEQDLAFSEIILQAYKYTSKIIRVSSELMQDSAFNMDAYIQGKFAERLGRATAAHYATGTGTAQPNGLVTASTNSGFTTASNAAVTYLELLDLKHSVDPSYRTGARWAFNDTTLKALKKLVDSNGLPLWSPAVISDAPATLDGDSYIIDQGIASIATVAKSIIYGDMSQYHIRDVMDMTMVRLVERYAEFGQVAFIAFMRTDADLLDTSAVKYMAQPV